MQYEYDSVKGELVGNKPTLHSARIYIAGNNFLLHREGNIQNIIHPPEFEIIVDAHKFYDQIERVFPDTKPQGPSYNPLCGKPGGVKLTRRCEAEEAEKILQDIHRFPFDSKPSLTWFGGASDPPLKDFTATYKEFTLQYSRKGLRINRQDQTIKGDKEDVYKWLSPGTSQQVEEFFAFIKQDPDRALEKLLRGQS